MRWDRLFADFEGQAEVLAQAERAAEVETRTRGESAQLGLVDRLRAALGAPLRLGVSGGVTVSGTLTRVGPDWLLLDEGAGREVLVVAGQLLGVRGLGRHSAVPGTAGVLESRLGLRHVLRGIARDRSAVRLHLAANIAGHGAALESLTVDATIDRVGADFIEVATHSAGEVRRRGDVRDVELIPIAAIAAIRRSV